MVWYVCVESGGMCVVLGAPAHCGVVCMWNQVEMCNFMCMCSLWLYVCVESEVHVLICG